MKRALLLAAAAVVYAVAAWNVTPGFYDGQPVPNYDYVSPPPELAPGNIAPTSGSGVVPAAGGTVTTHDQPTAQAAITFPKGALNVPATVQITPHALPASTGGVTLTGNVYCITASGDLAAGSTVSVTLFIPPAQPFPSAMYFAGPDDGEDWTSLGGSADLGLYLWSADSSQLGCFAVGYVTPARGTGPTLGGSALPAITAILIVAVLLAGLPAAIRRRSRPRG